MKSESLKNIGSRLAILMTAGVVVVSFQNCGQPLKTDDAPFGASSGSANLMSPGFIDGTQTQKNSCTFNDQKIASGQSVVAYAEAHVPQGQSCRMQLRVCQNGALSGSYGFKSCTVDQVPNGSCVFNGQIVPSGSSVDAFLTDQVPAGQTCARQTRTCTNGTLSGSYGFAACKIAASPAHKCQPTPARRYGCWIPVLNKNLPPLDEPNASGQYGFGGQTASWYVAFRLGARVSGTIDDLTFDRCVSLCETAFPGAGTQRRCNYSESVNDVVVSGAVTKKGDIRKTCNLITDATCLNGIADLPAINSVLPNSSSYSFGAVCQ